MFCVGGFICCLLLGAASLHAEQERSTTQKSVFHYAKHQGLAGQVCCLNDLIVLSDGTQHFGIISEIPSLSYPFGSVIIPRDKVRLICSLPHQKGKMKIFMRDGRIFIGDANTAGIEFIEYISTETASRYLQKRKLPVDAINFILIKPKEGIHPSLETCFHVTLTNGNEIPVQLVDPSLTVVDGWNHYVFSPNAIVDIVCNGGVYGRILNREGEESDLPLVFVKNLALTVAFPDDQKIQKILWKDIRRIQRMGTKPSPLSTRTGTSIEKAPGRQNISGLSVAVAESPKKPQYPVRFFDEKDRLDIPANISFMEDTSRSETMVAEDFNLEEWEQQSDDDEESDAEEFLFVAQGNALKKPHVIEKRAAAQSMHVRKNAANTHVFPKGERRDGMVYIAPKNPYSRGFYIKPRKITNGEYAHFVEAVNYKPPDYWVEGKIPERREDEPVVNITYKDAFLYAVWSGKRLPSREEIRLAFQESKMMVDKGDNLYEWTKTPSQGSRQGVYMRQTSLAPSTAAHFVCGFQREMSMQNDNHNNQTGFRIASD